MVREVISVNIGQCGIQLGHRIWKQYLAEHGIDKSSIQTNPTTTINGHRDASFHCFFKEDNTGRQLPRNLMIDLDPCCIDREIKSSPFSQIYENHFLLSGLEDAAHNFARGHYTIGKEIYDEYSNCMRLLVNECDNVQGFVINHSMGGGTGSGLGALILERIAVDYRKKSKLGFEVYPSNDYNEKIVVAPYNALLATHWLLDHTEVSMVFDNRKLINICKQISTNHKLSYDNLNSLISQIISSTTCSLRFEGEMNVDLNEFQCHMPFPRLHFMVPAMAPIINKETLMDNKQILVDGYVRNNLNNTDGILEGKDDEKQVILNSNEQEEITVTINRKQRIWDVYSIKKELETLNVKELQLICKADQIYIYGKNKDKQSRIIAEMMQRYKREYERKKFIASEKRKVSTIKLRIARQQNYIYNERPPLYQDIMNMLYSVYDIGSIDIGVYEITQEVFNECNFMVELPDFDPEFDKYMQISVNYRGNVKAKEANACVWQIKQDKQVVFVSWCPTGFKVGLNEIPITILENDFMATCDKSLTAIGNNTAISRFFTNRISKAYDKMYSQRAFVHWYVGEGMEEGEFAEAREDLGFLEKDYLDVLSEQATDEEEEDSD